ncbi:MAG TPA: glycosyltransferase family 9 protein, partial [Candidatus Wallbacteria bacterium]|nr:glycosyltransferase family 9 protein [Candidatus Wallbacteria bacterium]
KILIIRLSSAGDLVLTFPAFFYLLNKFPDSSIDWVVDARFSSLLDLLPGVNKKIIFPGKTLKDKTRPLSERFVALRRFLGELRAEKYDLSIDFQGLFKSGFIAFASKSKKRFSFKPGGHDSREMNNIFQTDLIDAEKPFAEGLSTKIFYRSLMLASKATGGEIGKMPIKLSIPIEDREMADSFFVEARKKFEFDRVIVLNPFTNWATKTWPVEKWIELIQLSRRDPRLVKALFILLWGPAELSSAEKIAAEAGPGAMLSPPTTLREVFAILDRADITVSGDSFALHAAYILEKPTVALFGASDPARCAPVGEKAETVTLKLPCQHCFKKTCRLNTNACIKNIDACAVLENIIKLI